MTPNEVKDTGQRLFKARQYPEALPLLRSATEAFPKDEVLWRELVLSASRTKQHDQAAEFGKQALRHHPRSDWLWLQLGSELTVCDRLDEADKALNNSRSLNPNAEWLWRYYAALHKKRKNLEMEIEAWENLHTIGAANSNDLNSLGIAYYQHKNFAKALKCYRLSAATEPSVAPLFNMGLVFNDPELSQDADAADAYRRALVLKPDYEPTKVQLESIRRKLMPLAERARVDAADLIQSNDFFQFYINPFEALQLEEFESPESLDLKVIQRAKKRLLQEIDLNDGKVPWLDDYPLDRSRAQAIDDELHDATKRSYHTAIFLNKRLLRFLTRGDISHFIYSDVYFPQETLEFLDEDTAFRTFLSKPFAQQYNLALTCAIERRLLPVIEVLFDGRRWVDLEHDDTCFAGVHSRIATLVESMRSLARDGGERKLAIREVEDFFLQNSLPDLLNLLPTPFASAQREFVAEIRSLAISCFNKHDDADLSKSVLSLCKRFTTRSVELTARLEEDFKAIESMIAEERKHESRLQFGAERPFEITKEGIRDGANFFSANSVKSLRWGITVTGNAGAKSIEYWLVATNDAGRTIQAMWWASKAGEDQQTTHFSGMVNAAMNYLGVIVAQKLHKRLVNGEQIVIGPCTLTRQGIAFQTQGFLFKKDRLVYWGDVTTDRRNGQIILTSKTASETSVAISMRDAENAVILPIINVIMQQE